MKRLSLSLLTALFLTVFFACAKNDVLLDTVIKNDVLPDTVVMQIASQYKDCTGPFPQKCMQVRTGDELNYSYFYSLIEGFVYEEGYEYKLIVRREQINNPPMDASSIRYLLVKQISKVKK